MRQNLTSLRGLYNLQLTRVTGARGPALPRPIPHGCNSPEVLLAANLFLAVLFWRSYIETTKKIFTILLSDLIPMEKQFGGSRRRVVTPLKQPHYTRKAWACLNLLRLEIQLNNCWFFSKEHPRPVVSTSVPTCIISFRLGKPRGGKDGAVCTPLVSNIKFPALVLGCSM